MNYSDTMNWNSIQEGYSVNMEIDGDKVRWYADGVFRGSKELPKRPFHLVFTSQPYSAGSIEIVILTINCK